MPIVRPVIGPVLEKVSGSPLAYRNGIAPFFDILFTSETLDSRVTMTRAGNVATRFNSSGLIETINADLPRFNYDPKTLQLRGLMIEPAATNLLLRANDFSNASWVKANVTVTADQASAGPFALMDNAANTPGSLSYVYQAGSLSLSTAYVFSVYAKRVSGLSRFGVSCGLGSGTSVAEFDLTSGTVALGAPAATIEDMGNGVYRCNLAVTTEGSGTAFLKATYIGAYGVPASACTIAQAYAQIETGSTPTSPIDTAGSSVTRNADQAAVTLPADSDILVQDLNGGAWITAVSAGAYNLAPRSGQRHIRRVRAYPAGYAATHAGMAVAY